MCDDITKPLTAIWAQIYLSLGLAVKAERQPMGGLLAAHITHPHDLLHHPTYLSKADVGMWISEDVGSDEAVVQLLHLQVHPQVLAGVLLGLVAEHGGHRRTDCSPSIRRKCSKRLRRRSAEGVVAGLAGRSCQAERLADWLVDVRILLVHFHDGWRVEGRLLECQAGGEPLGSRRSIPPRRDWPLDAGDPLKVPLKLEPGLATMGRDNSRLFLI